MVRRIYGIKLQNILLLFIVIPVVFLSVLFHVPITSEKITINCLVPPCDPPFITEEKTLADILLLDYKSNNNSQEPVFCAQIFQPVCGVNGKTFSNLCFADVAGVEVLHEGECNDDLVSGMVGQKDEIDLYDGISGN